MNIRRPKLTTFVPIVNRTSQPTVTFVPPQYRTCRNFWPFSSALRSYIDHFSEVNPSPLRSYLNRVMPGSCAECNLLITLGHMFNSLTQLFAEGSSLLVVR